MAWKIEADVCDHLRHLRLRPARRKPGVDAGACLVVRRQFALAGAVLACAAALVSGCSDPLATDYSGLGLVEVSGTVTLDGDPLPGATVIFEADDQTYSFGRTDASGRYDLMFNSEKSGVIPGRKIVRITMGPVGEEADAGEPEAGEDSPAPPDVAMPARYNERSELTADVSAERNEFDFDLLSE